MAGAFTWKEPSAKPAVADCGVTKYAVVFTSTDRANYESVETRVSLTVNRAQNAPNMPSVAMSVPYSCEKVEDVLLPEGREWQTSNQDIALEVGAEVSTVAVYTGEDKGSYVKETVTVAVTRSSCDHTAGDVLYTGAGEKAPPIRRTGWDTGNAPNAVS